MQRNTFFLLSFILLNMLSTYAGASTEHNFSSEDTTSTLECHIQKAHEPREDWHAMADLANVLEDNPEEWEQLEQAPARWSRWQACKAACKTIYEALRSALTKARDNVNPC